MAAEPRPTYEKQGNAWLILYFQAKFILLLHFPIYLLSVTSLFSNLNWSFELKVIFSPGCWFCSQLLQGSKERMAGFHKSYDTLLLVAFHLAAVKQVMFILPFCKRCVMIFFFPVKNKNRFTHLSRSCH